MKTLIHDLLKRAVVGKSVRIIGGKLDGAVAKIIPCERQTAPYVLIEMADGSTRMFWSDRLEVIGDAETT